MKGSVRFLKFIYLKFIYVHCDFNLVSIRLWRFSHVSVVNFLDLGRELGLCEVIVW
jgi:hypothetical protein